jgi:hypothetical protein
MEGMKQCLRDLFKSIFTFMVVEEVEPLIECLFLGRHDPNDKKKKYKQVLLLL